jgi:hypothetical protein
MNRTIAAIILLAAAATLGCSEGRLLVDSLGFNRGRWESPVTNFSSSSDDGDNYAQMAREIARELDSQIVPRMGIIGNRNAYYVAVTVPASLHSLDKTSALARLMAQEIANGLVALGYTVQEMRKGREILIDQKQGELYLTRNTRGLARQDVAATLVIVGTFSPAPGGTRFSIECLDARNNNMVAMSSRTVSAGAGSDAAFGGAPRNNGLAPTVVTTQGLRSMDFNIR